MNLYALSALGAGCLWGCTGLFTRLMSGLGLTSAGMLIVRCGTAALCFGVVLLLRNPRGFLIRKKDLWCFLALGIAGQFLFSLCYFTAITVMSVSTACILLYLSPALVVLLAHFIFRDAVGTRGILALILCVAGTAFVSGFGGSVSLWGLLLGVGSAVFFALINILTRLTLERGYESTTVNFYLCFIATLTACVIYGAREPFRIMTESWRSFLICAGAGVVAGFLPYLLFTHALSGCGSGRISNGKVSIMASTEPVVATLTGVLIFHEKLGVLGLLGILFVLASIVILNVDRKPAPESL